MNILESAEELKDKEIQFTSAAKNELYMLCNAVTEILSLSCDAFINNDLNSARKVEPLEQVIDKLRDKLRNGHIVRLKNGECSIEVGFIWSDLLTNLERTADHCSNLAVCVIDAAHNNMNLHSSLRKMKHDNAYFDEKYALYAQKYQIEEE